MNKQELRNSIAQLRAELQKTPASDEQVRAHVAQLIDEIEAAAGADEIPSQQHEELLGRLQGSVRQFETSHMSLTVAVGRVIDALSNMGV